MRLKKMKKHVSNKWKKPVRNYVVWKIGKEYRLFDVENPPESIGLLTEIK